MNISNESLQMLNALAKKLGVPAERLWRLLVMQAPVRRSTPQPYPLGLLRLMRGTGWLNAKRRRQMTLGTIIHRLLHGDPSFY